MFLFTIYVDDEYTAKKMETTCKKLGKSHILPTSFGLAECVDELSGTAKNGSTLSIGTSITKLTLLFSVFEGDGVEIAGSEGIFNVEIG